MIDAGGGITKISCHRIVANNTNAVVYAARGSWGGYYIDVRFIKFLKNAFGEETMNNFKLKHAEAHEILMNNFIQSKHTFDPKSDNFTSAVPKEFTNYLLNTAQDGVKKNRYLYMIQHLKMFSFALID